MLQLSDDTFHCILDYLKHRDVVSLMNTCHGYKKQMPRRSSFLQALVIPKTLIAKAQTYLCAYNLLLQESLDPKSIYMRINLGQGMEISSPEKASEIIETSKHAINIIYTKYLHPITGSSSREINEGVVWDIIRCGRGANVPNHRWYHFQTNISLFSEVEKGVSQPSTETKKNFAYAPVKGGYRRYKPSLGCAKIFTHYNTFLTL